MMVILKCKGCEVQPQMPARDFVFDAGLHHVLRPVSELATWPCSRASSGLKQLMKPT